MAGILAMAGAAEAWMMQGMALFAVAAIGTLLGFAGLFCCLCRSTKGSELPIILGVGAVLAALTFVGVFCTWSSLDDFVRVPFAIGLAALPFFSGTIAVTLAITYRKGRRNRR